MFALLFAATDVTEWATHLQLCCACRACREVRFARHVTTFFMCQNAWSR